MKYIGYYDVVENNDENRYVPLAGRNKMDYLVQVLSTFNSVEIVSASGVCGKKGAKASVQQLGDNVSIRRFHSIGRKNKLYSFISTRFLKFQLFCYLFIHIKPQETIIVYHSLGYCSLIRLIKFLKKPYLILEMEELYADVSGNQSDYRKEKKLADCADAFVFPTSLLNNTVNKKNKPNIIVHGSYRVEPDRHYNAFDCSKENAGDKTVHCVYAGTLDPRKGGAAAVDAAAYLPENYCIHIIGFGNNQDLAKINERINAVRSISKCKISYDGIKQGEEYIKFVQSCDIGLSTQDPKASFNSTSFPSKILSYLANGLRVVSIRIPAIETSAINDYLYYYNEQTPEQIANTIKSVDMSIPYDSREILKTLSDDFVENFKNLLRMSE